MDFAKITNPVKAILTTPKTGWPLVAVEPASIGSLYVPYIAILYSTAGGAAISVEIADTGSAKGFMAMAAEVTPEHQEQPDHGDDKTYTSDGRMVREKWDAQNRQGEYSLVIGQRYTVGASGPLDSLDQLKFAVQSVDPNKLESLKNAGISAN